MRSSLHCRNILVNGRRTSMRLEPMMWTMLEEIAAREGLSLHALVSGVEAKMRGEADSGPNLTATVRLVAMEYFRAAATEEGHRKAGHGLGEPFAALEASPRTQVPAERRRVGRPPGSRAAGREARAV